MYCAKGCCQLETTPYIDWGKHKQRFKKKKMKAGVFLYDSSEDAVLLVQSRGNLWGPPKGSANYKEAPFECAMRELTEETGLSIKLSEEDRYTMIHGQNFYFFIKHDICPVEVQKTKGNDANSVGWIRVPCLLEMIRNEKMSITSHCRSLLARFLNVTDIFSKK